MRDDTKNGCVADYMFIFWRARKHGTGMKAQASSVCGPWSATFQKMIKYFVENNLACVASVSNRVIVRKLERKQKKKG